MNTNLRPTGIDAVGDMPWGTHFCIFYDTKDDLLDVLLGYFKAGLENHEFCLWVTPEPLNVVDAQRALREAMPDFERYLTQGQIEIVSYADWYLAGGRFNSQRVLQSWTDKLDQALAKGYAGLRGTANTFWVEHIQWDSFAEYEAEIDKVLSKFQIIVLCTYPLARNSAKDMIEVVHHHRFTVARRAGTWEHLLGSELKRAYEEIQRLNDELERRVAERTAQLTAANEHLKTEIMEHQRSEEALRNSERLLREAETLGRTGSWEHDLATGEIVNTEENLRLFFGDDRRKRKPFEDFAGTIHPDDREFVLRQREHLLAEDNPRDIEYRVVWPDGSVHVIFGRATVVRDESGKAIRVYGTNVEVTERKRAEETLRQSESNFRTLAEKSLQGILISQGQKIVYANPAMAAITGYSVDEHMTRSLEATSATVYPDDKAMIEERARKRQAGEEVDPSVELRIVRKDGSIRWIHAFVSPIEYNGQPALLSVSIDISERKHAEETLRALSARLAEAEIAEQRRLARELHDQVGQNLTALSLNVNILRSWLPDGAPESVRFRMDDSLALLEQTTKQVHTVLTDLSPSVLDDYGLVASIRWYGEQVTRRTGVKISVEGDDLVPRLPIHVETILFRVIQEATTNVIKHADATQITMTVEADNEFVRVTVRDNGAGFDPLNIAGPSDEGGWGLLTMRERVDSLGGSLYVEAAPREGTSIHIEVRR